MRQSVFTTTYDQPATGWHGWQLAEPSPKQITLTLVDGALVGVVYDNDTVVPLDEIPRWVRYLVHHMRHALRRANSIDYAPQPLNHQLENDPTECNCACR